VRVSIPHWWPTYVGVDTVLKEAEARIESGDLGSAKRLVDEAERRLEENTPMPDTLRELMEGSSC